MSGALLPPNETARLAALARYEVLDSEPEPKFDRLTRLVARLLDVPIALVSLVDGERQWFKSRVGLDVSETPREQAFCAHALLNEGRPFVVPDALADPRFRDNPLVTAAPSIRAYAGAPLVTPDGFSLGTLCAIDRRPREFTRDQLDLLSELSVLASHELELRLQRRAALAAAEQARQVTEELRVLFDEAPLALWTLDPHGVVLSWNRAAEEIFGWSATEAVGTFLPTVGELERPQFEALVHELATTRVPQVVDRKRRRKDGTSVDVRLAISPLLAGDGSVRGFLTIAQDFGEELRLREQLRVAALVDPLTGLLNRRGFAEAAAREVARAERERGTIAVIMFDVDHFKRVNDAHGHATGDRVLAAVSRTIRRTLRGMDIGARWGGEELLALLPGTDAAGARRLGERARQAVASLAEPELPGVTISAGVTQWQTGERIDVAVARADERLYEAKAAGRNLVI